MVENAFHHGGGAAGALDEPVQVEYQTLVFAVLRLAAVADAVVDDYRVARLGGELHPVQIHPHLSPVDPDDLIFRVPVEHHVIAGVLRIHGIIGDGEIERPVADRFFVIHIFHDGYAAFL